ncbi:MULTISPECIES: MSMEG_1061 family FMN-dependent PPOX-type flavoprotein [unclassified Mesorhizobium]|uniref:MSMEG_1061 family FMN-dependent PPOX-type flavoprotein n=1 Tax=unclassified Mesorhizobium TaxID=325217 RepID=UPI000FCCD020|nr:MULTISPECIES: MSMEG_1061 family FMN-dependent PPOX-type flavoprotein [unclassified Mesorhizobium]TGP22017.1 pyridoxamine 5'-phosphate oxidase family protein [Mesorhizobium sp. M1D.F.Ca.ET.231.01.1.1]TGP30402.1 pyridoxamine 5'-phosphate oxidase family protein [Mesorhizobium sp. M1D.F.Ca.ET.234.01.1.1]TGS44478.1 pyridoxamine 5'-phosphate oxidase family protein [Mesorhizobium sp. M1D.F.Ca.ET.184.01.1.1]TGS60518.1 pyridoxamine 5'-phosphate oxidase family protein [Mesorhizobium sp. M1D.F.Ca.ET.18
MRQIRIVTASFARPKDARRCNGDKPGFAAILDNATVAIPDRPGNNRLDTLENVIRNPSVGLLFLIPGMNETLRVNGDARIAVDATLRERLAVDGKEPQSVIVVTVKAAYMHCAKAFMRSELWKPETWYDRASLPTLGQIIRDQLALSETANEIDRELDDDYRQTMW